MMFEVRISHIECRALYDYPIDIRNAILSVGGESFSHEGKGWE